MNMSDQLQLYSEFKSLTWAPNRGEKIPYIAFHLWDGDHTNDLFVIFSGLSIMPDYVIDYLYADYKEQTKKED